MLTLDQTVNLHCTDTGKDAAAVIVRINGNRVDVTLEGSDILIGLQMQRPGIYVGTMSGLEFVMKT